MRHTETAVATLLRSATRRVFAALKALGPSYDSSDYSGVFNGTSTGTSGTSSTGALWFYRAHFPDWGGANTTPPPKSVSTNKNIG